MAQVLTASQAMRAASQLRAGPSTGGSRAQCRQPVPVMGSFRASRFGDGSLRGAVRFDSCGSCRPRSFRGSRMGVGMGFEPGFLGMGSQVSGSDIRKVMKDLEDAFGRKSPVDDVDPVTGGHYLRIPVDVEESTAAYTFAADIPGVSRADTKVQADREERKLTISGERFGPERTEESKNRKRCNERRFGKFSRTFKLPKDADLGAISASFRNGVLDVTVKRVKPVEPEVTDVPIDDWIDVEDVAQEPDITPEE